jgi:KaiC/GvpD/RAD55 family RecA-like ATPase
MNQRITLNLFAGVHGVDPVSQEMTLDQLTEFLAPLEPPRVTREERRLKELFSMNIYKPDTTRGKENVEAMTGAVFDFDNKEEFVPIETVIQRLTEKKIAYFWYTTHSHKESRPKWRLIIPFATPLSVAEWPSFYQYCVILLGSPPGIDHGACKDVARMWYPPYGNEGHPYTAESHTSLFLMEPLDIQLHLTPEEQAHFKAREEERKKATSTPLAPSPVSQSKSNFTLRQAWQALGCLDEECDDYHQWLNVGRALHHQFNGHKTAFNIWNAWSGQSGKYINTQDLVTHWISFADKEKSVSIGTLIHMAKEKGYDPLREKNTKPLSHLINVNLRQFLSQEIPPLEMILDPIIPEQGLVMLYAPRGIGKTYLSLSIAYIVAAGKYMLDGRWKAEKTSKILFVDGEMPAGRLQERMAHLVMSAGELSDDDLFNIITPDLQEMGIPDLSKVEGQKLIEEHLDGVKLLILDNLSSLFRSGSENEAESWKCAQEWLLTLRRRGVSVLLVHHANKNGSQRGTSKKEDLLDTVISLRRPEDYDPAEGARFEVHYEKARGFYGEDAKPFEVQLVEKEDQYFWVVKDMEDTEMKEIVELYKEGLNHRKISKQLGLSESTVYRRLMKLKKKETEGAM